MTKSGHTVSKASLARKRRACIHKVEPNFGYLASIQSQFTRGRIMKQPVLGIDISKATFDVVLLEGE